jgi:Flp pilus assembly protein TadD
VVLTSEEDAEHILQAGESNRYRIEHISSEAALLALPAAPDVLLCPISIGENSLLRLHQRLQPHKTAFLLAGSLRYSSAEVSRIAHGLISWPVHLLELTDTLDRLQSSLRRADLKIKQENAQRLALLWSRGETGWLSYKGVAGIGQGELEMFEGGTGPDCWERLYPLLHSGTIRFKRSRNLEPGGADRMWLGRLLLNAAWKQGRSTFSQRCADGVLAPLSFELSLPLAQPTQRLLSAADGNETVEEILRRLRITPLAVGEDLYAMHWLALLQWKKHPTQLHPRGENGRPRPAHTDRSMYSQTSVTTRVRSKRLERPDTVRVWLNKAQNDLAQASPESILGVSGRVSEEMLKTAERRLLNRYDEILGATNVPDDIEQMAQNLRRMTEKAAARIRQRGQPSTHSNPVADYRSGHQKTREDELLERGDRLLEAQDWAQADHLLSDAVRISPQHPGVLTALAWARYNNAGLNKPDREGSAKALLQQAIDIDSSYAEAHYRLAQLHRNAGNSIAARAAARRATRLEPDEARYETLLNQL